VTCKLNLGRTISDHMIYVVTESNGTFMKILVRDELSTVVFKKGSFYLECLLNKETFFDCLSYKSGLLLFSVSPDYLKVNVTGSDMMKEFVRKILNHSYLHD
jgi:hypothetical protein